MKTHCERHTNSKLVALHHISEERYNGYEDGCASPKHIEHDRIYTTLKNHNHQRSVITRTEGNSPLTIHFISASRASIALLIHLSSQAKNLMNLTCRMNNE